MNDKPDFGRLLKVLWREGEPDRVPFFEVLVDPEVIEAMTGEPMAKAGIGYEAVVRHESRMGRTRGSRVKEPGSGQERYVKSLIKFYRGLRYDYLPLGCSTLDMPGFYDERWKWTDDTAEMGHEQRTWLKEGGGLIENREDFNNYPWPDAEDIQMSALYDLAVKNLSPEMEIIAVVGGCPYTIYEGVTFMMGMVPFFRALHADPSLVRRMFEKLGSYALAFQRLNSELERVGACIMADDMGFRTGPMMAPRHFREHVFPWYKKCVETVHKSGKPFILHSCGNLRMLMDDFIGLGIDAKHSFEDTTYPIHEYKKPYGEHITLLGGVSVDKLSMMPQADFRFYVRKIISECAGGGGYALGSGNSVTNYVKLYNYLTMLEVGRRYGRYPIRMC